MVKLMTQGKGLAGLDTKRPWGAVVLTDGKRNSHLRSSFPSTDLKQLVEAGQDQSATAPKLSSSTTTYMKSKPAAASRSTSSRKAHWAIVTDKRENLANAPADPLKLLGDLPKDTIWRFASRSRTSPSMFAPAVLAQLQMGMAMSMAQRPERKRRRIQRPHVLHQMGYRGSHRPGPGDGRDHAGLERRSQQDQNLSRLPTHGQERHETGRSVRRGQARQDRLRRIRVARRRRDRPFHRHA